MNKIKLIAIILFFMPLWGNATSQVTGMQTPVGVQAEEIRRISSDVAEATRQIEFIKRDQVNYKIEKDLLKEAYGSNLQTINQVVTIVFGVFGVIGFLGIRSISEIRQEHMQEIDRIRALKGTFEDELSKLRIHQNHFDTQMQTLMEQNLSQDRRLKSLELIEKIATLVRKGDYFWALQNIDACLTTTPDDVILLGYKIQCLSGLGRPRDAAAVCLRLMALEPANDRHIFNLLEYQAIGGLFKEFEEVYLANKSIIEARNNGALAMYLKLLKLGFSGGYDSLKKEALDYIEDKKKLPATPLLENWSFEDVKTALNTHSDIRAKALLQVVVSYFSGEMTPAAFSNSFAE